MYFVSEISLVQGNYDLGMKLQLYRINLQDGPLSPSG